MDDTRLRKALITHIWKYSLEGQQQVITFLGKEASPSGPQVGTLIFLAVLFQAVGDWTNNRRNVDSIRRKDDDLLRNVLRSRGQVASSHQGGNYRI